MGLHLKKYSQVAVKTRNRRSGADLMHTSVPTSAALLFLHIQLSGLKGKNENAKYKTYIPSLS